MELKFTFEDGSEALMHYGVKGMRWKKGRKPQGQFLSEIKRVKGTKQDSSEKTSLKNRAAENRNRVRMNARRARTLKASGTDAAAAVKRAKNAFRKTGFKGKRAAMDKKTARNIAKGRKVHGTTSSILVR